MPKTSRTEVVWKSKRIPDYFKVPQRSGKYKIWSQTVSEFLRPNTI